MAVLEPAALKTHSKLFAFLDDTGRQRMVACASEELARVGTAVVTEGEVGDTFFLVVDGEMSVRINGAEERHEVAKLGPGGFFGEIAALLGEPRSATVVALKETRLVRFDGPAVNAVLKDYPKVREALVKLGLKRSEENVQHMIEGDLGDE